MAGPAPGSLPEIDLTTDAPPLDADMRADNDEDAPDLASSTDRYAARFAGAGGRYLLDRQDEGILGLLAAAGAAAPMRVLDVGGGHMQTAPLLAVRGDSVVVHASADEALRRYQRFAGQGVHAASVSARTGHMFALPAGDKEFDLVVCIRMLGHVSRWRDLLGELCRVSCRFVLVEFAAPSGAQRLARPLFALKRRIEKNTRHYTTYEVPDVARELESRGFNVVAVDRQFALPIVLHRVLQRPAISRRVESWLARAGVTRRIGGPVLLLAERR